MSGPSPTLGRPGGEHRVLEPVGAEPLVATRLDALADLWDGELRLELEALVLSVGSHRGWTGRLSRRAEVLRAALVETVAERGGLGEEARDGVLVGHVAATGAAHPHPATVGQRVVVAVPPTAVPLFAIPSEDWDGGRVVPLRGHAVVPAGAATIAVGDAPAELAAVLAEVADVPSILVAGHRVVVLGLGRPAGVVAVVVAVAQGRHVTAAGRTLGEVRLARALGASATTVLDLGDAIGSADHLLEVAGAHAAPLDLAIVADPRAAPLAPRLAPSVQILTDPVTAPDVVARTVLHARAAGRGVSVHAGRGPVTGGGDALHDLLASSELLLAALRWQAGIGPPPETEPEEGDA